jgi:hypothetical protein
VLHCEQHRAFWEALDLEHLQPGHTRSLSVGDLADAWATMPVTSAQLEPPTPPDTGATTPAAT